jgi:hypothetical protein
VDVGSCRFYGRMPEDFADDVERYSDVREPSSAGMPEIVSPHSRISEMFDERSPVDRRRCLLIDLSFDDARQDGVVDPIVPAGPEQPLGGRVVRGSVSPRIQSTSSTSRPMAIFFGKTENPTMYVPWWRNVHDGRGSQVWQ